MIGTRLARRYGLWVDEKKKAICGAVFCIALHRFWDIGTKKEHVWRCHGVKSVANTIPSTAIAVLCEFCGIMYTSKI